MSGEYEALEIDPLPRNEVTFCKGAKGGVQGWYDNEAS